MGKKHERCPHEKTCEDKKCFAAVIDFGLVCNMSDPDDCWISGSPGYMAPEVALAAKTA